MDTIYQSLANRVMAAAIVAIAAAGLVTFGIRGGLSGLVVSGPSLLLIALAAWAMYWRPAVLVDARRIRIVNVLSTVDVDWAELIALDTTWSLALVTKSSKISVWAAPARGALSSMRAQRRHRAAYAAGTTPPGQSAAALDQRIRGRDSDVPDPLTVEILRCWDAASDDTGGVAGAVADDGAGQRAAMRRHWHSGTLAAAGVLTIATVLGVLL